MNFEVIIIGGSYAGLQAATTLGRALRKVLVIDNGKPCNAQTPRSHNFLLRMELHQRILQQLQKNSLVYILPFRL